MSTTVVQDKDAARGDFAEVALGITAAMYVAGWVFALVDPRDWSTYTCAVCGQPAACGDLIHEWADVDAPTGNVRSVVHADECAEILAAVARQWTVCDYSRIVVTMGRL